jgi:hypothetical protein
MTSNSNFLIIAGASKCGTTSLHHWLKKHPDIFCPQMKELHFFSYQSLEKRTQGYGDNWILKTLCGSWKQYVNIFSKAPISNIKVDNSPSYFFYSKETASLIQSSLDNPKIIIVLRDPVEKIFSQYMHLLKDGRETLSFEAALNIEDKRYEDGFSDMWLYKRSGLYSSNLENFLKVFPDKDIKVVFLEDMKHSPDRFVKNILTFVGLHTDFDLGDAEIYNSSGVPRSRLFSRYLLGGPLYSLAKMFLPPQIGGTVKRFLQKLNTGEKEFLNEETRDYLRAFYLNDIYRVEDILNMERNSLVEKFNWN